MTGRRLLRVIQAEINRVVRKPFIYIIPLLFLIYVIPDEVGAYNRALAFYAGTIEMLPGVPNPFAGVDLSQMLYWFRWENILTSAGATCLAGLGGTSLVGYVGAVWFADDLQTGVNKQIAVLRKRLMLVISGKFLTLALYMAGILIFVALVSVLTTLFLSEIPGREPAALLRWIPLRNIMLCSIMAVMWASLVAMITLLSRSPVLGAAVGVVWPLVETVGLITGNSKIQLFLAKITPISTIHSLLAFIYDRFSWVIDSTPVVLWTTSPPLTRTMGTVYGMEALVPFLLPFSSLLTVLVVYTLVGFGGIAIGYYLRTRD
jgi:hypothetical protein